MAERTVQKLQTEIDRMRLHCWQRRARRLGWRKTWSILYRASATSNYCFFGLPPLLCSTKASGTSRSWSLGVSSTLGRTSLGDIWRSWGPSKLL